MKTIRTKRYASKHTALISIKITWYPNHINRHPSLSINVDIQGLLSDQSRGVPRFEETIQAIMRDLEEFRCARRRRKVISISNAREVILSKFFCAAHDGS